MPEPSPATELRTAAATLRRQATDDEHWGPLGAGEVGAAVPALARPLADWLDLFAATKFDEHADIEVTDRSHEAAVAVARAVNGTTEPADPDHGAPPAAGVCDRCRQWEGKPDLRLLCPQCGQPWSRRINAEETT